MCIVYDCIKFVALQKYKVIVMLGVSYAVACLHSSTCDHRGNFTPWCAAAGNAQMSIHFPFTGRCAGILDHIAQ